MKWLGVSKFLTLFLPTYTFCCCSRGLGSIVKSNYLCSICTILSLVKPVQFAVFARVEQIDQENNICNKASLVLLLAFSQVPSFGSGNHDFKAKHLLQTHAYYLLLTAWHELGSDVGFPYLGQYFLMNYTKPVKVHWHIHSK